MCECSVADIYDETRSKKNIPQFDAIKKRLSLKDVLLQSTTAVNFIHGKDLIHRNLHPDNFLISCVDAIDEIFIIKLTDFEDSKDREEPLTQKTKRSSGIQGCWAAPESCVGSSNVTQPKFDIPALKKIDSFIIGLFYFFVLSEGNHPFGKGERQIVNIKNKNYIVYKDEWDAGETKTVRSIIFFLL